MLEEQIQKDYVTAMKARDAIKSSALSFLRAQLKNILVNDRKDKLEDAEVISVIKKQVKQRQESIEQFKLGGRQDLVDKESRELEILKSYLPAEMTKEAVAKIVEETIKEIGASSVKDMGAVMKALMPKVAGKADNKLVSEVVKEKLAG